MAREKAQGSANTYGRRARLCLKCARFRTYEWLQNKRKYAICLKKLALYLGRVEKGFWKPGCVASYLRNENISKMAMWDMLQ